MNLDVLIAIPITIVLVVVWAFPVVVLLKQKYVLFAAGLALTLLGVLGFDRGSLPSIAANAAGQLVWIVAAVRLAPPASRWARQLYGADKLARARERPAGTATRIVEDQHGSRQAEPAPAPDPPRILVVAAIVTVIGFAVLGLLGGVFGLIAPGAVLPLLWLVRAGWRRGRTVVTVVAVLITGDAVYGLVGAGAFVTGWIGLAVGVLLLGAGLVLLHRDPSAAYLADTTR